jgi:hypothetical protein
MLDLLSTAGILDFQLNFFMIMNETCCFKVYDTHFASTTYVRSSWLNIQLKAT